MAIALIFGGCNGEKEAAKSPPVPSAVTARPAPTAAAGRPQDRVARLGPGGVSLSDLEPYVRQARATLGDAKKRFLGGLGPGQRLYLTTRITEPNGLEQVFVEVVAWEDAAIRTRIDSHLEVAKRHHRGEALTIHEKDVLDWTIVHPDGREEGNFVGKYLDTRTGGAQPEPPALPVGAWVKVHEPELGDFLGYTYIDSTAGLSLKAGRVSSPPTAFEAKMAAEMPNGTFRLPIGLPIEPLDAEEVKKLGLPKKPSWMKYYE